MKCILLLFKHRTNGLLLKKALDKDFHGVLDFAGEHIDRPCDLIMVDAPSLLQYGRDLKERINREKPVFLPVVLLSHSRSLQYHLHQFNVPISSILYPPVQRYELMLTVQNLLYTRELSQMLKKRNEDLETFIHLMSHDLRAPLRAIKGFSKAILEDHLAETPEGQSELTDFLKRIHRSSEEMEELITSILNYLSCERRTAQRTPISMPQLVKEVVKGLRYEIEKSHTQIDIQLTPEKLAVDPFLTKTVLQNLIHNAMKFVPPKRRPHIRITGERKQSDYVIKIQDNGIGIPRQHARHIFKPFNRLHGVESYPGVGLGLAVVKRSMEIMGGEVGVTSSPGQGSEFWLKFKLKK